MSLIYNPYTDATEHTEEEVQQIVDLFTANKKPVEESKRNIIVFNGTVGSGKTYSMIKYYNSLSKDQKDQTVFNAFDENGVIYAMPKYWDEIYDLHIKYNHLPHQQRMEIRDKYQRDTHYIFPLIQQTAKDNGNNLLIDMTMQGQFALASLDPYKEEGRKIILNSFISGIEIAKKRVDNRVRSLWQEEFSSKYDNWFYNFKNLLNNVDELNLYYNPNNIDEPELIVSFANGIATSFNDPVYTSMQQELDNQEKSPKEFLEEMKSIKDGYISTPI